MRAAAEEDCTSEGAELRGSKVEMVLVEEESWGNGSTLMIPLCRW